DGTAQVGQELTASVDLVSDADNPGGAITGPVAFYWQVERDPGGAPGVFEDIVDEAGGSPASQEGGRFTVTADLDGLRLRVKAIYQDANGVLETAFSAATDAVAPGTPAGPAPILPDGSNVESEGIHLITSDLQFILDQIKIAEQHAAGSDILDLIANSRLPFGLRTVDGSFNNLVQDQTEFGAADNTFPRLLDPFFRNDQDEAPFFGVTNTDFAQSGNVVDADPRIISNLIVDQTSNNPAAVAVAGEIGADLIWGTNDDLLNDGVTIIGRKAGQDTLLNTEDDIVFFSFENVTPDEGLSAPFNLWFVFFGQFFDHGLDLVQKGGNEVVFIPLQPDDPLITLGPDGTANTGDEAQPGQQFMVLTRATTYAGPGADGIVGDDPATVGVDESLDDTVEHLNQTSPFVDQNQTYASHASHQAFLRTYETGSDGRPYATGELLTNRDLVDGVFGNGDDVPLGGMSTWAVLKAQARDILGITLTDADVGNVPLLATDPYGNFIRGENGFPQVVVLNGLGETVLVEGNPVT
ncbi:MAG: peroxidase family protein, partial [Gammaproteobacteria bacterium]